MAIKINNTTVINDNKIFIVGTGTTAERPGTPVQGMIWYNTTLGYLENYNGSAWVPLGRDTFARTVAFLGL